LFLSAGHGSSQFWKLFGRIALDVFPVMPLDCGNRSAAVFSKPLDVNSLFNPTVMNVWRVQLALSRFDLTPRRIRY
jgi:hypothetical protein